MVGRRGRGSTGGVALQDSRRGSLGGVARSGAWLCKIQAPDTGADEGSWGPLLHLRAGRRGRRALVPAAISSLCRYVFETFEIRFGTFPNSCLSALSPARDRGSDRAGVPPGFLLSRTRSISIARRVIIGQRQNVPQNPSMPPPT